MCCRWEKPAHWQARYVILISDGWHWQIIGYLSYATSSLKSVFETIFVKYAQICQPNTNTNISSCGFSNTNICESKYKYKYVFDPNPEISICAEDWDCETVRTVKQSWQISKCKGWRQTVKQSEPGIKLSPQGYNVFSLVDKWPGLCG